MDTKNDIIISHLPQFKGHVPTKFDQKLIDDFLLNLKKQNKSEHTIESYALDLSRFLEWLYLNEEGSLTKVDQKTILKYMDFLKNGGLLYQRKKEEKFVLKIKSFFVPKKIFYKERLRLSVSAQKRHLSTIKNFFQFLKEVHEDRAKIFKNNPVKSKLHHIKLKEIDVEPTPHLSREDFLKIEEKIYRTKERLAVYLLYYGGLRLNELRMLKVSDFNFHAKSVHLERKGGLVHDLILRQGDKIFGQLNFLIQNNPPDSLNAYIFNNKNGGPITRKTMYNYIKKILAKSLVPEFLSPHSFRKACATEYYLECKDLLLVRDYLNHSDAKVTQTYIDKLAIHRYSLH